MIESTGVEKKGWVTRDSSEESPDKPIVDRKSVVLEYRSELSGGVGGGRILKMG